MGSDKKLRLENLPDKLEGVIKPEGGNIVIKLWKVVTNLMCPENYTHSLDDRQEVKTKSTKITNKINIWFISSIL